MSAQSFVLSRAQRCCGICRLPGHIRSHCPSLLPLPVYGLADIQGMPLLEFLRAILLFADPACSEQRGPYAREQMRYSALASSYLASPDYHHSEYGLSHLRARYPLSPIVRVHFRVVHDGHAGGCSDPDEEYSERDVEDRSFEVDCYLALPPGLVGDLSDIDLDLLPPYEHVQCWCHGSSDSWYVLSLELV